MRTGGIRSDTVGRMIDLTRDIAAILRIDLDRWRGLATLSRHLLDRQPQPGEWSALECLVHATDSEPVFGQRFRAILDDAEAFPPVVPDPAAIAAKDVGDPADLVARLARHRAVNQGILELVTEADLDKSSRHARLGPITLREMISEYPAHDLMHIVQAERAVMQAYIPKVGPWRPLFADHDVATPAAD
jgi:hypothetical protein